MKARLYEGEGFWLRAERQVGGKGRLGRVWESPEGNLYCSTLVGVKPGDPPASTLSFVAALAVHDAIRKCLPDADLFLKWPNDIQLSGAKVCGILLERSGDDVVVGIGVNVAVTPTVEDKLVTCLHDEGANKQIKAADFLELLANTFASRLDSWRAEGLPATLGQWEKRALPAGTPLSVSTDRDTRIPGEYAGLTSEGALRLRKPDGALIEIHAGDVETG